MKKGAGGLILTRLGDLLIRTVVDESCFEGGGVSPEIHSHAYYELLIALDGEMGVELANGTRITLQRDDICLLPPDCFHCTHRTNGEPNMLGIRFFFQQIETEVCLGLNLNTLPDNKSFGLFKSTIINDFIPVINHILYRINYHRKQISNYATQLDTFSSDLFSLKSRVSSLENS